MTKVQEIDISNISDADFIAQAKTNIGEVVKNA